MITRVDGVVEADIDGERVLLAPSSLTYFGLNPVGARVWDLVGSDGIVKESLLDQLLSEFDVDAETCRTDVDDFITAATKAGTVQETG